MSETAWICIAAISIVAIIALALSFKNSQPMETGVSYEYDDQSRVKSITPTSSSMRVVLKPAQEE